MSFTLRQQIPWNLACYLATVITWYLASVCFQGIFSILHIRMVSGFLIMKQGPRAQWRYNLGPKILGN